MKNTISQNICTKQSNQNDQDDVDLVKLGILSDAYNYLFDEALERVNNIADYSPQNLCYLYLIKGLILFKKFKSQDKAIATFQEGIKHAQKIDDHMQKITELAFLKNAIYLVKTINIITTQTKDKQPEYLYAIIAEEHEILQEVCEVFLNSSETNLHSSKLLNMIFILTTIIENIAKLNKLVGLQHDNIDLYLTYEHIFKILASRMQKEKYHTSFIISYSHALINTTVNIASGYLAINEYKKAYDTTKILLVKVAEHGVNINDNYWAYILNAHACFCIKKGYIAEAYDCLAKICDICLDYNDPHTIKMVINNFVADLATTLPDVYKQLNLVGMITNNTTNDLKTEIIVSSSTLDLENNHSLGMEQLIANENTLQELKAYDDPNKRLQATFLHYALWRQIAIN